ncbi:hypothetical protein M408DRAFT_211473 [Serendipita vermifera MAFF 305830]|uniref:Lysine-specific metallo-endopeptidase domain-containing protein n=1 Tax=Serendipita vermifera MAFF 305830 TaxID=933852 RepID=A0A0C3B1R0_SERVB|nr:hypothetical protein M408DRAFT_211473 [Serendipita vermifera MAFF 305830]
MFSSLLSLLLVVPLISAIPVPLGAEFVNHNAATHAAEKTKFDDALGVANTQIKNMQNVLKNPNDPRIAQAFGPKADLATIQSTVNKLETKTMKVHTSDPVFADKERAQEVKAAAQREERRIAEAKSKGEKNIPPSRYPPSNSIPNTIAVNGFVPVDTGSGERVTSPARFGSTFYSGNSETDKKFRAGTIIHEATHYLAATGDHVAPGDKIIRAGAQQPAGTVIGGGYASDPVIKTDAHMGERYTNLRAASNNMHHNADSYRVFASLCSRSLFKRALTEEDPIGYYLAKRQQCSLPPDYFKKKAEAKAAAANGVSASPASAKQITGKIAANAKAGVKGASTTKGFKSAKTTKAGKGIKATKAGKGVKSTRTSLTKGTKATKGGRAAKGTKTFRAANGVKGAGAAKGLKTVKGAKGLKAMKSLKATKGTRGAKTVKGAKAVKGVKAAKGLRSPKGANGAKSLKTPKGSKFIKGAKAVKGAKAAKGLRSPKTAKGAKGAKGTKALKTSRGAKASKAVKGSKASKAVKVTKGVKAAKEVRTAKAGKAGKVAKASKGVKATKAAKTSKGVKATKGKATNSRTAAGRKTTTSRASNKATKSTASRSSQKVTKAAPRVATKPATKAAPRVVAKASVPKKAGKKN